LGVELAYWITAKCQSELQALYHQFRSVASDKLAISWPCALLSDPRNIRDLLCGPISFDSIACGWTRLMHCSGGFTTSAGQKAGCCMGTRMRVTSSAYGQRATRLERPITRQRFSVAAHLSNGPIAVVFHSIQPYTKYSVYVSGRTPWEDISNRCLPSSSPL
jgi:hypothetical protein